MGVPDSFKVNVTDLPDIAVSYVGSVGPVSVSGIPDTYAVGITAIPQIRLRADPVDLTVRIAEIPSVRGHVPSDYRLGLCILGFEIVSLRLCGETQVITERYVPNPCERCGIERAPGRVSASSANVSAVLRLSEVAEPES